MTKSRPVVVAFWIVTALFCVEMIFTAYWEWFTPQAAQAFARLEFPAESFRVELSVAKMLGVLVLLVPAIPARVKEWAYAGFAFNLMSALIAHASIQSAFSLDVFVCVVETPGNAAPVLFAGGSVRPEITGRSRF